MAIPAALERRSDLESIREDIEPYRGTSVEQRSEIMSALCRFAAEQIAFHPRGADILAYQDARSPTSSELWQRLIARARRR